MRSPLSHRAAAVTAIGATALFTAAGLAAAVPASAQARPALSVSAPATDPAMQPIYIKGVLHEGTTAVARQAIVLEVARPGRPMGPLTYPHVTTSSGAVSFKIRAAGTWKWELVFRGASGLPATHSRVVTIKVP
jgi:hypothetical protein